MYYTILQHESASGAVLSAFCAARTSNARIPAARAKPP